MMHREEQFDHILLIGHGSPDPRGNAEYLDCARLLAERLDAPVRSCFLELAEPSIEEGIRLCVEAGAQQIAVLPLFLGAAGHQKNDVPVLINEARVRYPHVELRYGAPIGAQYPLVATLADRAAEAIATSAAEIPAAETALIVVGRGSSDPDSNSEVFKVSRLLWEGRDYGWVETAFQTVTRPQIATAVERCARLGARRVVVLPYLLFTGFVHSDIERQAAAQTQHEDVEVLMARHLANHGGVIDAIAQRYRDMVEGVATMTCDICKYRHRFTGFEKDYGRPQEAHHHHHHDHHHHHGGHHHDHHHGGHHHDHHHHGGHHHDHHHREEEEV